MDVISITKYVNDPRRDQKKEHSLECIFYITLAAVIAGAESWYEVEEFGKLKESFFSSRIKNFRGVPSHDTFNRVFSLLDPVNLESCFRVWVREICGKYKGIVAIDGKTICGASRERKDGSFEKLHVVSAWACANGVTLGQEKVSEKSNEITAIPALIQALDLSECIITIDAMGCQKAIVAGIIDKKADYVICLKENQKKFYREVKGYFEEFQEKHLPCTRYGTYSTEERNHGRYEKRLYEVYYNGVLHLQYNEWAGLKSLVCLTSYREELKSGKVSQEKRFYITSLGLEPEKIASAIRTHWSIENNLHWQLDVTFREDDTRKSKNAALNFSLINKIALATVKNNTKKGSLKGKRKAAGWDEKFLSELLDNEWEF